MRYDLGCGNTCASGFIGVDLDKNTGAAINDDISILSSITDGTAEELRAFHCLEHFPERFIVPILSLWFRKLVVGGKLTVASPDVEFGWKTYFLEKYSDWQCLRLMIGDDQLATPFMIHKTMFWPRRLISLFLQAGFSNVVHVGDFGENVIVEGYK